MSEYPWNKKNKTFTWLSLLYNPFKRWPPLMSWAKQLLLKSHYLTYEKFSWQFMYTLISPWHNLKWALRTKDGLFGAQILSKTTVSPHHSSKMRYISYFNICNTPQLISQILNFQQMLRKNIHKKLPWNIIPIVLSS